MEARPAPPFRSDQDLLAWRMGLSLAIPVTVLALGLFFRMNGAFAWSPVAAIPGVLIILFIRWDVRRDRRLGRRFRHYDISDLDP